MKNLCDPTAKAVTKYVIQAFFIGSFDDEKSFDDEECAQRYLQGPKSDCRERRLIRRTEEVIAQKTAKEYIKDLQDY